MPPEESKAVVRHYYEDLWNAWDLSLADDLVAPDISSRGSLHVTSHGIEAFKEYVSIVRAAFPDFHNTVEDIIAEGEKVVARLTYRGTHKGALMGIPPTGREVTYAGVAIFRVVNGKIAEGWVLGDINGLLETFPLWQTLLHLSNHTAHHRAEVCTGLTALGSPPWSVDLIDFMRQAAGEL